MDNLISRQAAIEMIKDADVCVAWNGVISNEDAVDIAIRATKRSVIGSIEELPSAQTEIVRCKDCKHRGGLSGFYCDIVEKAVGVDSFCSWAERRTDDLQ